ncbi:Fic family protein [Campylobacter upsaliensis]
MKDILSQIDTLADFVNKNPLNPKFEQSLNENFKLHYTYDSNAIEGNTLTLIETKVVLEGITIGGKTLREHFEVINHAEAIQLIEDLAKNKENLSEYQIKCIHHLILKGIDDKNAGAYRNTEVYISGARHIPPSYINVLSEMDNFIKWYQNESLALHPVIRASRVHINFVEIHPFIDGNGRTSRLLMNLELLKAKLPAINIKNDRKLKYYEALDKAHYENDFYDFDMLIADYVLQRLEEKKELILKENAKNILRNKR